MSLPLLIGAGGPAVSALLAGLAAIPGLAGRVRLLHLPPVPEHQGGARPEATPEALAGTLAVLDEVATPGGSSLAPAERAALPRGCPVLRLPRPALTALWPLAGETAAEREANPFHDRLAVQLRQADAAPAALMAAYASARITELADLDAMLEEDFARLAAREQGCDLRLMAVVAAQFRTARLFHSASLPAPALLAVLLAQALAHPALRRLPAMPLDAALQAALPAMAAAVAGDQAPVHPGVAAHFGLAWWRPDLAYAQDGWHGGFADWTLRNLSPPAPPPPPPPPLHPGGEVARTPPFFATEINPALAPEGAALLSEDAARYAAPAVTIRAGASPLRGAGPDWRQDESGIATILPRLVAHARLRRRDPALRLVLPEAARTPFLTQALDLLGTADATEWQDAATPAREIAGLSPRDVSPYAAIAARALAGMVPLGTPGPRLVHLTTPGPRAPTNAAEVSQVLQALGFVVADPATLSLAARIALLRDARALVAAQGPALDELAFLPPGAAVLELTGPTTPCMRWWSLASVCGLRYGCIVGDAAEEGFTVPTAMLHAAVMVMGR
jgi:hypothetical protein